MIKLKAIRCLIHWSGHMLPSSLDSRPGAPFKRLVLLRFVYVLQFSLCSTGGIEDEDESKDCTAEHWFAIDAGRRRGVAVAAVVIFDPFPRGWDTINAIYTLLVFEMEIKLKRYAIDWSSESVRDHTKNEARFNWNICVTRLSLVQE